MSKKDTLGQSCRRTVVVITLLVAVHYAMLRWMDGSNAFAVLTASGNETPMLTTVGAMAFVGLRLYLYLVVPGMAVARMGAATLRWYCQRTPRPAATSAQVKETGAGAVLSG